MWYRVGPLTVWTRDYFQCGIWDRRCDWCRAHGHSAVCREAMEDSLRGGVERSAASGSSWTPHARHSKRTSSCSPTDVQLDCCPAAQVAAAPAVGAAARYGPRHLDVRLTCTEPVSEKDKTTRNERNDTAQRRLIED